MKFRSLAGRLGLLVAAAWLSNAGEALAQCGPDNLNIGSCCSPTFATLPTFPAVQIPGLGICWTNCVPTQQAPQTIDWTAPVQTVCGQFQSQIFVRDVGSGNMLLAGVMTLDYTRTWTEFDSTGTPFQVWRFAAKADMKVATFGIPQLCPIPNCIAPFGPHNTAFFYGFLDYASNCTGVPPRATLVLYHANDFFVHNPSLSSRPGAFHPTKGFAIVAPHNSAQTFIPAVQLSPQGPIQGEATRNVSLTAAGGCFVEDPILGGTITRLGGACLCNFATFPKQHTFRVINGTNACVNTAGVGGSFTSLNFSFPNLPWYHMMTTSIGFWSNPTVYPSNASVWVDEGLFLRTDACTGTFVSIEYGGSSRGGFSKLLPNGLPLTGFTDLADNYTAPIGGPFPFPILGNALPTDQLIYVNVP